MNRNLTIDYLTTSDIYDLQDLTGIQIMFDGEVDEESLSEAIRSLLRNAAQNR